MRCDIYPSSWPANKHGFHLKVDAVKDKLKQRGLVCLQKPSPIVVLQDAQGL